MIWSRALLLARQTQQPLLPKQCNHAHRQARVKVGNWGACSGPSGPRARRRHGQNCVCTYVCVFTFGPVRKFASAVGAAALCSSPLWRHTAVLAKTSHANCCTTLTNQPLRGRRGRFVRVVQQLACEVFERTAVRKRIDEACRMEYSPSEHVRFSQSKRGLTGWALLEFHRFRGVLAGLLFHQWERRVALQYRHPCVTCPFSGQASLDGVVGLDSF